MTNIETNAPEVLPEWLADATKRLKAVTGFVTVHPNGGDPRTLAYSRYDHVARVASLALSVGDERRLPRAEVLLLSWLHDINRWPFAHNAETGRFDQAGDIERFIAGRLPRKVVTQAAGIAGKHLPDLDMAARTVLLADMVTGFFEDTLFVITGLNLSPSELPDDALDLLRLPVGDFAFLEELRDLFTLLNRRFDVPAYTRGFNSLVFRSARRFLDEHNLLATDQLESDRFGKMRAKLRDEYLRNHIFPLNNEHVCHGELIRQVVVDPVLSRLSDDAEVNLTRWTEIDLISYLLQERLATGERLAAVAPTLDYVSRFESHRSFM